MPGKNNRDTLGLLQYLLHLIFILSIICSIRFLSSLAPAAIALLAFVQNKKATGSFFLKQKLSLFAWACIAFYLLQIIALAYTDDMKEGIRHLEIKSMLFAIPVMYTFVVALAPEFCKKLLNGFVYILALTTVYFIIMASVKYSNSGDSSVFFYHELVSPRGQHAIQFSLLVFIGIAFILHNLKQHQYTKYRLLHIGLLVYLILFLVLLSSKLILSFTIVFFIVYLILYFKKNRVVTVAMLALFTTGVALTLLTKNPVSNRFTEIIKGGFTLVGDEEYNPAIYFNGLQFRLLQWRHVSEIVTEKNAWLAGVSPGDAQNALNEKYAARKMYVGDANQGSHGFIGYNAHNQLLESTLQTGIIGLLVFLVACFGLMRMAWQTKNMFFIAIALLLIANTFIESVFETQYGLIIYTFFPFLLRGGVKMTASARPENAGTFQ